MAISVFSLETAMRKAFGPAVRLYRDERSAMTIWLRPDDTSWYLLTLSLDPRVLVDEIHDLLDAVRIFQDGEIIWG